MEDWWSWWSLGGRIIIIVSSYFSVSMTLWALGRGRAVRRMSSGSRCVGWAFGLAFAIRTMRMVMMMMTIFFSLFRAQAFDIISESCAVQSNASSNYALTWMFILWFEFLWFPSDFVHLNVFFFRKCCKESRLFLNGSVIFQIVFFPTKGALT